MDNYNEIFDSYLMHSNRPGSHWYQHKYGKWQSQAVYAQGQPNPDANDKQQASAGAGKGKVEVLSKKAFNDLPPKDRVRMQIDAAEGKNYEFNKRIRDSLQNEKDGSSGTIDTYMPTRGPAQLNWEKSNGKVIFRELLFNRKVSDRYADTVLNRSMYGGYTRK